MTFSTKDNEISYVLPKNPDLGQVWTPTSVADEMVRLVTDHISFHPKLIVDPAVGPGTFVASLNRAGYLNHSTHLKAFDVDNRMVKATRELKKVDQLFCEVKHADYLTHTKLKNQADLVIMNPPYIRHEKLADEKKIAYADVIAASLGERVPKRSNLFAYFLLKGLSDLKHGGILCAIVYDGLTETKVGQTVLDLSKRNAELLVTKSVKMPFEGAIIDASIVVMRRRPFRIELDELPSPPRSYDGYVPICDLAKVNRGTGLINSRYFVAKPEDRFYDEANIFIKKGTRSRGLVIEDNHAERAYLFENKHDVPDNFADWMLNRASGSDFKTKTLFDMVSSRPNEWFLHNTYKPSILFNYFLRNEPRHLFNPNNYPVADNYYGIEPFDIPEGVAWLLLNSPHYSRSLLNNSRSQGNGLRKLQLYEYREASVPDWRVISDSHLAVLGGLSRTALKARTISRENSRTVTKILNCYFPDSPQ